MKLLIYSHFFAPSVGGVEAVVQSLARGLAGRRDSRGQPEFEITVVTQTPASQFDDLSLPFRVFRAPGLLQLWSLIRNSDAIHLAGPSLLPLFLGKLAGKPVAIEHHVYQAVCPNGLLIHKPDDAVCPGHFLQRHYGECAKCLAHESAAPRNWIRLLLMLPRYLLSRRAAANLAVSNYSSNRCGLPRSSVIYHGIEDLPHNAAPREQPKLAGGKVCFAYVGRLVSEKGVAILVEAARLLHAEGHSFEVRLIGDGPERSNLEAIIAREQLESCVRITGFLMGDALLEALSDVSAVVMPSVWEETAGLAAIEQMMRGGLVIASDIGGLGEIVGEGGLKFPAGDAQALAAKLRVVLQEPSMIIPLGKAARARALSLFLRERMVADHARVYRELAVRPSE